MTQTTLIQCSAEDLRAIVAEEAQKAISAALAEVIRPADGKPEDSEYLTRNQVCQMLHISKPTFHCWVNTGLLETHKVGSRTLVKKADLQRKIEAGEIVRYKHQK